MTDSNKGLSEALKELREETNITKNQYDKQQGEVDKALTLAKFHEAEKQRAIEQAEEYKGRVKATQTRMKEFKDTMDKILIKLSLLRQEINELRKKNEEIVHENERISIRAAVGFDNLTPRPNFKKLSTEYEFELMLVDEKKKSFSTVNIVGSMAKKIKELNQKIIDAANEANKFPKGDFNKKSIMKKSTSEMKNSTRNNLTVKQKNLKTSDESADALQPSFDDIQTPLSNLERKESKLKVEVPRLIVENTFGQEVLNKTKILVDEIKQVKYSLDNIQSDGED